MFASLIRTSFNEAATFICIDFIAAMFEFQTNQKQTKKRTKTTKKTIPTTSASFYVRIHSLYNPTNLFFIGGTFHYELIFLLLELWLFFRGHYSQQLVL